jgi:hypothetical protein
MIAKAEESSSSQSQTSSSPVKSFFINDDGSEKLRYVKKQDEGPQDQPSVPLRP